MKKNKLIIISDLYPFDIGDNFLHTEVIFLASKFKEIIIVPRLKGSVLREIPNNVIVDLRLIQIGNFDIFKILMSNFVFISKFKQLIIALKRINYSYIFNTIRTFYSYCIFGEIYAKRLQSLNGPEVVFYSYWLKEAAYSFSLFESKSDYKFISRAHGSDIYDINYGLPFRTEIFKTLNKCFFISKNGYDYAVNRLKVDINNLEISRLGIEKLYQSKIKIERNHLVTISCSNCIAIKRVELICELIRNFCAKHDEIKILHFHIGGGGDLFSELKEKFTTKLTNCGISFLGNMSNQEVQKFYSEVNGDLFLNLSLSEGVPVSMMEALAYGMPIFATNVGGVKEIVNNKTGILVEKDATLHGLLHDFEECIENLDTFNKDQIIEFWSENYNFEINYGEFANKLVKLEHC